MAELHAKSSKLRNIRRSVRKFPQSRDGHRDVRSAEADFDSRASNTSTAKSTRLPTNTTVKDREKLFRAITISLTREVFFSPGGEKKKKKKPSQTESQI